MVDYNKITIQSYYRNLITVNNKRKIDVFEKGFRGTAGVPLNKLPKTKQSASSKLTALKPNYNKGRLESSLDS